MALPIAIQLYSVRHEMKEDVRATLEKIKKMGYDGVEFAGLFEKDPADIKAMCKEIGLIPVSAHVNIREMLQDADATFANYAAIGMHYVAIPSLPTEYRPGNEQFAEVIEKIKEIGAVAKKYDIQLLYHNHDFEFVKLDGAYGLDILYREVSQDLLQTELDVCWVNVGGEDPADYIRKYAGRCPIVHLKDFWGEKSENMYELIGEKTVAAPKRPDGFEFRPVGFGKQDMPSILRAAVESGATWVVVEQDNPSMGLDELACAEKSVQYLKSINW